MPKKYIKKGRKQYVPQNKRMSTIARPLASKYGDELFIKVQAVTELTVDAENNVFSYMRVNGTSSSINNIQLFDQAEFAPFRNLYGFYEVKGMKAEMSVSALSGASGAGLYAGIAPALDPSATVPTNDNLVKLPIQTKGNT